MNYKLYKLKENNIKTNNLCTLLWLVGDEISVSDWLSVVGLSSDITSRAQKDQKTIVQLVRLLRTEDRDPNSSEHKYWADRREQEQQGQRILLTFWTI